MRVNHMIRLNEIYALSCGGEEKTIAYSESAFENNKTNNNYFIVIFLWDISL